MVAFGGAELVFEASDPFAVFFAPAVDGYDEDGVDAVVGAEEGEVAFFEVFIGNGCSRGDFAGRDGADDVVAFALEGQREGLVEVGCGGVEFVVVGFVGGVFDGAALCFVDDWGDVDGGGLFGVDIAIGGDFLFSLAGGEEDCRGEEEDCRGEEEESGAKE